MGSRGIIGAALLVAIIAGAARAADLPLKAPPPIAAPWSWTGFYIGGNIGGALGYSTLQDPFGPVSFGDKVTTSAFIGGRQFGARRRGRSGGVPLNNNIVRAGVNYKIGWL